MAKVITSNAAFSRVLRNWGRVMMHHSRRDFMRIMRESGLSMPQLSLFMRIHYHRNVCNVSDVAAKLGVSNARARQGLLERSDDPDDRRVKRRCSEWCTPGTIAGRAYLHVVRSAVRTNKRYAHKANRSCERTGMTSY